MQSHLLVRSVLALLMLSAVATWVGCRADTTGLSTLTVEQLSALQSSDADLVLCDANTEETRSRDGVIPGAVLLSNYRDYDAAAELPTEQGKQVVFYCHSAMCGAAVEAARKAVAEGWRNVWVMPDGIRGWTEAGLTVERRAAG
jgi:rhodanese-related sulfurtransferase